MYESDQMPSVRNDVEAKNRREAVKKLIEGNPTLKELYDPGPNDDGKGGWVNAIKDQHRQVYRLLFYIDRLPLGIEWKDKESYEILYGEIGENDEPNFPRALFTTTGAINLMRDSIPGPPFAIAINTNSLEIVPFELEGDLLTAPLLKRGIAYVCAFDGKEQGLRILDLREYSEIYCSKDQQEIQVRNENTVIVGDTKLVRAFYLKYIVRRAEPEAIDPRDAANRMLGESD
ncbi:hypothetical protein Q31b_38100 [Novipirellula aureliae]|uniref:Uncharacterized protein n=1 Tax=Novipirellula aureliae TaxID=2527966 RepID=A0A5C6DQ36_9BACT|nr:hypothetical protein [Novipirellula aureliae]TWU38732.1 hypothetical protein Q31b_38100 [Novipirellula aureliae]